MKKIEIIYDDHEGHVDYTRHACRGIIVNGDKILLSYESKEDKYLIPGGGLEDNETLLDCVKRELLEETGYIVSPKEEYLEINEYFYWNKNWLHVQHYFVCEILKDTHKQLLTDCEKEAGLITKWVSIQKAIEIFSRNKEYEKTDKATYGLYKRELIALEEFLKLNITP